MPNFSIIRKEISTDWTLGAQSIKEDIIAKNTIFVFNQNIHL